MKARSTTGWGYVRAAILAVREGREQHADGGRVGNSDGVDFRLKLTPAFFRHSCLSLGCLAAPMGAGLAGRSSMSSAGEAQPVPGPTREGPAGGAEIKPLIPAGGVSAR